MKLPQGKKERMQFLVLGLILVAGIGYVLITFVQKPVSRKLKATRDETAKLKADLEKAVNEGKLIDRHREDNHEILTKLIEQTQQHSLSNRFGFYELSAKEILLRHAQSVGLKLTLRVEEPGAISGPEKGRFFRVCKARGTTTANTRDTARFLALIEKENPYLCLTQLMIQAQPLESAKHTISFEIQWPIWADPGLPTTLNNQLQKLNELNNNGADKTSEAPKPAAQNEAAVPGVGTAG